MRQATTAQHRVKLLYHTHEEWAQKVQGQLVRLGCSESYASRRAELIRKAGEVVTTP
jgi:hypothetical protein